MQLLSAVYRNWFIEGLNISPNISSNLVFQSILNSNFKKASLGCHWQFWILNVKPKKTNFFNLFLQWKKLSIPSVRLSLSIFMQTNPFNNNKKKDEHKSSSSEKKKHSTLPYKTFEASHCAKNSTIFFFLLLFSSFGFCCSPFALRFIMLSMCFNLSLHKE